MTEAELCAVFIRRLSKDWTAYAETGGFDILAVRSDGIQIGIEAKLRLNAKVVNQALDGYSSFWRYQDVGPDFRAILVPKKGGRDLDKICEFIGVTVLRCEPDGRVFPNLPPEGGRDVFRSIYWHDCGHVERLPLPEYVPDTAAGDKAPVQLSAWKIKALKIAVLMERRGYVTRADFRALQISASRWLARGHGWLVPGDNGFVAGPYLPDFKAQHPKVYAEIEADFEEWKPKELI